MLSIIIVAYKPDINKLNKLINEINSQYEIILIDNSESNTEIQIQNNQNIKVIKTKNNGNGAAINIGLKNSKTKYALYMDIDVEIEKNFFKDFITMAEKINEFGVLVPNHGNLIETKNYIEKYSGEASVMFFNLNEIRKTTLFDEKYFLYFEEEDLFFQCKKLKIKVYFINEIKIKHNRASSVSKNVENLDNIRSWHYMWSMFYFYKKNNNFIYGFKKVSRFILADIIMVFLSLIVFNFKNIKKRFYRIWGLTVSILGMNSFLRP